ncbi:S8 family serine peptidase [Limnochorda pilosa]|uniref:Peptidase S8 n=1 Tax=Limnochorda pilosa TaxID=1555112 RepID=A0A0K2SQG0_LIMPI|nr:S8 family serine peptidase [Limnochorda pilosa]BAS29336.1 peptidase S8 [Limnochorda pilosa]
MPWLVLALVLGVAPPGDVARAGAHPAPEPASTPQPVLRVPGAPGRRPAYREGELLVRFREEADGAAGPSPGQPDGPRAVAVRKIEALGAKVMRVLELPRGHEPAPSVGGRLRLYHVRLPDALGVEDALSRLREDPDVLYAEPNYLRYPTQTRVRPNDPLFVRQWAMDNAGQDFAYDPTGAQVSGTPDADIDAPEAWSTITDAADIVVAVVDTGIDVGHPDLVANLWVNPAEAGGLPGVDDDGNGCIDDVHGCDFTTYPRNGVVYDDPRDDFHGTHVAGIIGAQGDNGEGVAGVAWRVRILSAKFLAGEAGGSVADEIEALAYAAANGAHIINASYGSPQFSTFERDAIEATGLLFVAAAGNGGDDGVGDDNDATPSYPASYDLPNVIAVAATDWNDRLSSFSNYGAHTVDLAAPGDLILSTVPRGWVAPGEPPYAFASGTSMAAPVVTGASALLMAAFPDAPPFPGAPGGGMGPTVKEMFLGSVDRLPGLNGRVATGGRLNLAAALRHEETPPPRSQEPVRQGPNPARSTARFYVDAGGGAKELRIFDVSGREVFQATIPEGQGMFEWDLRDGAGRPLANGTYLFVLVTGERVSRPQTLVIER